MKYFWGSLAILLRFLTKNQYEIIFTGNISDFVNFAMIKKYNVIKINKQYPGVMGIATIIKIPPTTLARKSELWIGCEIRGFLVSPNQFIADIEECFTALAKKHPNKIQDVNSYVNFLKNSFSESSLRGLLFKNCFLFKKQAFPTKKFPSRLVLPLRENV